MYNNMNANEKSWSVLQFSFVYYIDFF